LKKNIGDEEKYGAFFLRILCGSPNLAMSKKGQNFLFVTRKCRCCGGALALQECRLDILYTKSWISVA
jgi:hypothetical protein